METETQSAFVGTKDEQKIAGYAFEVMKRKGMLFAANAPIRMSVDSIAKALTKPGGPMAGTKVESLIPKIEASLSKNETVFARADSGEFVTTKAGRAYHGGGGDNAHTFKERLNAEAVSLDSEAAKEYAESLVNRAAARAERTTLQIDSIIDLRPSAVAPPVQHTPQITFDSATVIPQHLAPHPPGMETPVRPDETRAPAPPRTGTETVIPGPEPVTRAPQPSEPEVAPRKTDARRVEQEVAEPETAQQRTVEVAPAPAVTPGAKPEVEPAAAAGGTAQAPPSKPEPRVAPAAPAPATEAAPASATRPAPQPEAPAPAPARPKPAAVEQPKPAAPVVTGPVEMRIATPDGPVTVDLRDPVDDILANEAVASALREMVGAAVEEDGRLIRFGSDIFPEEAVERFSKGDFRRIKDFLDEPETGGVASDREIMEYALNRRQEHPDYERLRFSLNHRMLKEKKDFEFVGVDTNRLWMSAGATPVTIPKRKPAEIGQDYRYLEDPAIVSVEEEEEQAEPVTAGPGPLEYSLTYYEYENGVLPYDRRAKRVFQGPVFEDQRASLLQFEIPQLFTSILAELRYPTGNRGGFIMGLGDFFAEHMVPGARFTLLPTDRGDNIFEMQFTRTSEEEANLLQFDDRRSRYVFRPVSFAVETDPTMVLNQEKFGKLHNHKKLEDAERKRPDGVITNAFEVVGDQADDKYWAILDDLYPVVNIERPISRSWLKTMLSGAYPFFYPDETTEGAYFYDPSRRPS
jgi:hypothetical protein